MNSRYTKFKRRRSLIFHLHTIWLFTLNDLKSIVLPETVFGIFGALSGEKLTTNAKPDLFVILERLPKIIVWSWVNLLLFDVANQRLPASIIEDQVNKAWRPLPSQRLTSDEARHLLMAMLPLVCLVTYSLGGLLESTIMIALSWMYNDLGGADENFVIRNLINACGFMCYSSGATVVAAGYGQYELNTNASKWLAIVGLVVFTTLQMQDMADMEGDAARGRRTLPLVYGESIAQWSIAVAVAFWSIGCPVFWNCGAIGYLASVSVGSLLSVRVIIFRGPHAYRKTWVCWCIWTITIYLQPLLSDMNLGHLRSAGLWSNAPLGQ